MVFGGESRWRKVALYAGLALLILLVFGALQAFNTTLPVRIWHYTFNLNIFNPETSAETLIFTGLTGLVFLLLLLLLMLLLRNILKIYTGQGSSGLGARLRSRMVLGAVIIALMPAVFMFLFSYTLMNRSLDRWFSPNTTQLREDSNKVVMELAQYVTSNARGEAESIVASGATERSLATLQQVLVSHRITLDGGFVLVYGKDLRVMASFQAPPESSPATLVPWL